MMNTDSVIIKYRTGTHAVINLGTWGTLNQFKKVPPSLSGYSIVD
jgi:hypothetical protein